MVPGIEYNIFNFINIRMALYLSNIYKKLKITFKLIYLHSGLITDTDENTQSAIDKCPFADKNTNLLNIIQNIYFSNFAIFVRYCHTF